MEDVSASAAELVTERSATGGVYSLAPFDDDAVLGTVNSRTHLYRFRITDGIGELWQQPGATHYGHVSSFVFVCACDWVCA